MFFSRPGGRAWGTVRFRFTFKTVKVNKSCQTDVIHEIRRLTCLEQQEGWAEYTDDAWTSGSKHVRGERTCICSLLRVGSSRSTRSSPSQSRLLFTGCRAEFSPHVHPCPYFRVPQASFAVRCVYLLVIRCDTGELAEDHPRRPGSCFFTSVMRNSQQLRGTVSNTDLQPY